MAGQNTLGGINLRTSDFGGPPGILGPMFGEGPRGLAAEDGSEVGPLLVGGPPPAFLSILESEVGID